MTSNLHNEHDLLKLAADGDRDAYGQLYAHYYSILFSSLTTISKSAEEAEEIIQETFVKAWISREALILVRSFGDYIFTVARNMLFDRMRKSKSRLKAEQEYTSRFDTESLLTDNDLSYKQYYRTAYEAIQRLSDQKREIFLLRTQEGLTLEEIAIRVGLSRSAVKKHLYATLKHLKAALIQHGDWLSILLLLWNY